MHIPVLNELSGINFYVIGIIIYVLIKDDATKDTSSDDKTTISLKCGVEYTLEGLTFLVIKKLKWYV